METITFKCPAQITRKIAGHEFTLDFTKVPEETLRWQFLYGTRGLNDYANSAKKVVVDGGGTWTVGDAQGWVDAWLSGKIAEKVQRSSGGSVMDPVAEAARQLACADICARLGGDSPLTWKAAADHATGKKYFTISDKGNVSRNTAAVDEYIERHDAKAPDAVKYATRAKAIVDAKSVDAVEVDL